MEANMLNATDRVIAELRTENDKLKGILANSDLDCIYCGLPLADLTKCASGFPGCERAEDMLAVMDFTGLEIPDATAATEYATDIASMYTVNDTDIASMYTVTDIFSVGPDIDDMVRSK
jgi:hypothetical protein